MLTYYLKCKKIYIERENGNSKALKTRNDKTVLLSKYTICGSKKSRFIK